MVNRDDDDDDDDANLTWLLMFTAMVNEMVK